MDDERRRELVTGWFEQYADRVLAYLSHRAGPDLAQDLVQDVFVVAYRKADRIEEPVIAWLFGTARRLTANDRRGRSRRQALLERVAGERPGAGTVAEDDEDGERARLHAALAELSDGDREVLMLAYWYDLTPAEAAAALGCRPNTFSVRLHRARSRLQAQLRGAELVTRP